MNPGNDELHVNADENHNFNLLIKMKTGRTILPIQFLFPKTFFWHTNPKINPPHSGQEIYF
jgi:hypothetical protein